MNHRRALGRLLGLVVALFAGVGLELIAAAADEEKVVVHRPDVRRIRHPRRVPLTSP